MSSPSDTPPMAPRHVGAVLEAELAELNAFLAAAVATVPDVSAVILDSSVTMNLYAAAFEAMPTHAPRLERASATTSPASTDSDSDTVPSPPRTRRRGLREFYISDDLPTVYARALEMQGADAPWDYASARTALEAAIDAESVPGGRYLPVIFTYPKTHSDGLTFRMLLMNEESIVPDADGVGDHATHTGVARHVNDYGISMDSALNYLTYDYLAHRSRQEGIGLRGLTGTDAYDTRAAVLDGHERSHRTGRFESYDTILGHMLK